MQRTGIPQTLAAPGKQHEHAVPHGALQGTLLAACVAHTTHTAHAACVARGPSSGAAAPYAQPLPVVLDTNIVLDVLLFQAPDAQPLRAALQAAEARWLATDRMREELQRVLAYPHIAQRVQFHGTTPAQILALRDQWAQQVDAAPRCNCICKDADDQCFIDLAVAHGALLLSKDAQVLKLRKRLARQGVVVSRTFAASALASMPSPSPALAGATAFHTPA